MELGKNVPGPVWKWFADLSKVPRSPEDTGTVAAYMKAFGESLGLRTVRDKADNVVIFKPAAPGYENAPAVMLQAHTDMVCEKAHGVEHDFLTEGIEILQDGDRIFANGTTLGADDAIGCAYMMALLESRDIPHPALECAFTTLEETTMNGAMSLDCSDFKCRYLINIDGDASFRFGSEAERHICLTIPVTRSPFEGVSYAVCLHGLRGGHSGGNATSERGNALQLMGRLLLRFNEKGGIRLVSMKGGNTPSVIPASSQAVITLPKGAEGGIRALTDAWLDEVEAELGERDERPVIELTPVEASPKEALDETSTALVLRSLVILPDGVDKHHDVLVKKMESTLTIGSVETLDDSVRIAVGIRSLNRDRETFLTEKIFAFADLIGASKEITLDAPEWPYKRGSFLEKRVRELFDDADVSYAEGTLEVSILLSKMPGVEGLCMTPAVYNPHSPDEHLYASDITKEWERLKAILASLKDD